MIIYDSNGQVMMVMMAIEDVEFILGEGARGLVLLSAITPVGSLASFPPVKELFENEDEVNHFHRSMVREFKRGRN